MFEPSGPRPAVVRQLVIPWPTVQQWRGWLLRGLVLAIIVYLTYVVREIWVPLLLAFLLATVLDPVVDRLELRGWSRGWAASFIYAVFLAALVTAIVFAYDPVIKQLQTIQAGINAQFPDTSPTGLRQSMNRLGVHATFQDVLIRVWQGTAATFKSSTRLMDYGMTMVTNLIWLIIIPIIAYYALRDYHLILAKSLLLVPKERREIVQTAVAETTAVFAKYLRGMAIVSVLNGMATWLLLSFFHIPSALVIAIAAMILYNVPYLGAITINVLTAVVAFLVHGSVHDMAVVSAFSLFMHHILFDQIISPRILGGHVGLHPILSIVALLVGNLLLGIIGMILAVPVAACIQIGVLALVPKLRHEIEIPKEPQQEPETVSHLAEQSLEIHTKTDATEELHRSVTAAVDNIEEKIDEADANSPTT